MRSGLALHGDRKKYIDGTYDTSYMTCTLWCIAVIFSIYQDFPSDIFFPFTEYYSTKGQIISE